MNNTNNYLNFNIKDYETIFEEYTTDLKNFIETFSGARHELINYIKRYGLNELEAKYYPLLGFTKKDILEDITDLQSPKKEETKTSYTLSEILDTYKSSSPWIVPNLLRSTGMYFLVAEPKIGKSLLMSNLIYSVAVSGTFLDRPCKTGKVLYFPLEDPKESVGERLFLSGFSDVYDPETSLVVNFADRVRIETKLDLHSDATWLLDLINDYKPILTIIDTFRTATLRCSADENTNNIGKLALVLQQIFHVTETCGIIVHHMNKTNGRSKTSLVERVSGHSSIAAASDGIIGLEAEQTPEGKIISLRTAPRHGTACNIKYKLSLEIHNGGLWKLTKVWEDSPINTPMCSAILRVLFENVDTSKKVSFRQLASRIGTSASNKEFSSIINWLLNNQIISGEYSPVKKEFLFYIHPESAWMVKKTSLYESVSKDILDANKLTQCQTKKDLRALFNEWNWDKDILAKSLGMLLPKEKDRIRTLIKKPEFEPGSEVRIADSDIIGKVIDTKVETSLQAKLDFLVEVETDSGVIELRETELILVEEEVDYSEAVDIQESETKEGAFTSFDENVESELDFSFSTKAGGYLDFNELDNND